jgi:hypothetical protein
MDMQSVVPVEVEKTLSLNAEELLPLTFTALDGLAFAAMRARLGQGPAKRLAATSLGPLLELLRLSGDGSLPRVDCMPWIDLSPLTDFYGAYRRQDQLWISSATRRLGLLRTTERPDEDSILRFCSAAQRAATSARFGKLISRQIAAAVHEMLDNIYLHSKKSETGLAAFHAGSRKFEFVVLDGGIGILRSLKQSAEFTRLTDHGDALQLALTDGCSRYGTNSNHGHGFSPLFVGLSNLNGSLRFRSGDHALLIDGKDPRNIPWRKSAKPPISGFSASVCMEV